MLPGSYPSCWRDSTSSRGWKGVGRVGGVGVFVVAAAAGCLAGHPFARHLLFVTVRVDYLLQLKGKSGEDFDGEVDGGGLFVLGHDKGHLFGGLGTHLDLTQVVGRVDPEMKT